MGDVYFAPAHEPPTLRSILEPPPTLDAGSPWLHIGTTTTDDLSGFSFQADDDLDVVGPAFTDLEHTLRIAAVFDVPLELLGLPEPDHRRASVRVDYWIPTLRHAPWKQPGLTGRRYRIARRQFARARRDWIRAGRPRHKCSTFIPTANITIDREAPGHTTQETP